MRVVKRKAGRVLLRDREGRVLLFQFARADGERFWATPGGGLEEGESFEEGARRELAEELGLSDLALRPAFTRSATFTWNGDTIEQEEHYFLALLERPLTLDADWVARLKMENIHDHRWWALDELAVTEIVVYPEGLAAHLRRLDESGM